MRWPCRRGSSPAPSSSIAKIDLTRAPFPAHRGHRLLPSEITFDRRPCRATPAFPRAYPFVGRLYGGCAAGPANGRQPARGDGVRAVLYGDMREPGEMRCGPFCEAPTSCIWRAAPPPFWRSHPCSALPRRRARRGPAAMPSCISMPGSTANARKSATTRSLSVLIGTIRSPPFASSPDTGSSTGTPASAAKSSVMVRANTRSSGSTGMTRSARCAVSRTAAALRKAQMVRMDSSTAANPTPGTTMAGMGPVFT